MEEQTNRLVKSSAQFSVGLLVGILFGLVIAILMFSGSTGGVPRYLRDRGTCKSNLSRIGQGIAIYQAGNRERSPSDIQAIVADSGGPGLFVCPSVHRAEIDWPKESNQFPEAANRNTDYIYVPLPGDAETGLLTAFELPANHQQEVVNALYADFHTGDISDSNMFMAAVQKTNDGLAAERGRRP